MKNLLILLALTFVFACHTKEDQKSSGINDPVNMIYNDIDPSVVSSSAETAPVGEVRKEAVDTSAAAADVCIDSTLIQADKMCIQVVAPVCGCDGKQYNNECEALKAGVVKFTEGPCEKKKEESKGKKKKKK